MSAAQEFTDAEWHRLWEWGCVTSGDGMLWTNADKRLFDRIRKLAFCECGLRKGNHRC